MNIPKGFCQCGCGEKTNIADRNRLDRGWIIGEPLKVIKGHFYNKNNFVMPSCCECGCGQITTIRGGKSARFITGHNIIPKPVMERLWSKVNIKGLDDCWEWQETGRDGYGYGKILFRGKTDRASRVVWISVNGEIPKDLFILHRCDNRPCCNPNHLFLGTNMDNVIDMMQKGRNPQGDTHYKKKLLKEEVIEVRELAKQMKYKEISAIYGIGIKQVCAIVTHRAWVNV